MIKEQKQHIQQTFQEDTPTTTLKILIIALGVVLILAGLFVTNKWFLALMLAWVVMP